MTPVSTNLGIPGALAPPSAVRASTPGWRDPRLWIGVAIVAVSVIIGARVLATADDTVAVWVASEDVAAGGAVSVETLEVRRVRFDQDASLDLYLLATEDLSPDAQLTRAVGAGEMLPRAALGTASDADTVEVPVAVEEEQVPDSVTVGSIVDIYLVATIGSAADPKSAAGPVLSGVSVVDAVGVEDSFGTSGKRQIVVAVDRADVDGFFADLSESESAMITVIRTG